MSPCRDTSCPSRTQGRDHPAPAMGRRPGPPWLWPLRASVMIRSNSAGGSPPAARRRSPIAWPSRRRENDRSRSPGTTCLHLCLLRSYRQPGAGLVRQRRSAATPGRVQPATCPAGPATGASSAHARTGRARPCRGLPVRPGHGLWCLRRGRPRTPAARRRRHECFHGGRPMPRIRSLACRLPVVRQRPGRRVRLRDIRHVGSLTSQQRCDTVVSSRRLRATPTSKRAMLKVQNGSPTTCSPVAGP